MNIFSSLGIFKEILSKVRQGGPPQSVKRHKERGKLLARERIDLLVDKNTPFIELSTLAAYDLYSNEFPSAGIITGIGVIHGKETMFIANDATVKGGTYVKETIKKHVRAQEIAMENHLPCVYLVDSGGCFYRNRRMFFPTNMISDDFFSTRRGFQPKGYHRSLWLWGHARQEVHMFLQ